MTIRVNCLDSPVAIINQCLIEDVSYFLMKEE